jgi:beta-galactosidase
MNNNYILYGGDYNPEQWLKVPGIFEKDLELMKKAGINTVTMGMFSWSFLEPEEGKYNFDWLELIMDRLYESGISTILGTPSGARPKWLSDKYPEVLRVSDNRVRNLFGGRHNHCYTSPVYREKIRQIDMSLAKRFTGHKGVIMWHISNEFGGDCHCPLCQDAFKSWLKERYKTIDALNDAWCTGFWSHVYNSFDQIESPSSIGEQRLHGLNLDWKRFVTDQTADFARWEIKALKDAGATQPTTVNLMYDYKGLNYDKLAESVDIISWDSYPVWHKTEDIVTARDNGFQHDFMRSLKHQPFLLMESCPSSTDWQGVSKLKRPGLLSAASLQALAHGSDSVLYFQIRQNIGGSEKFHGAVIDHYGEEDTRVFTEIKQLGESLKGLGEVTGSGTKASVALIYDIENRWAMEDSQGPRNDGLYYHEAVLKSYNALRSLGLNVDVISQEQDISGYELVAAPMLYLFREGIQEKIRSFVEDGGSFVLTYWSGIVDFADRCFLGGTPNGLMDVFGLRRTETDGLFDGEVNELAAGNDSMFTRSYECKHLCDLLKTDTAKAHLYYGKEFYQGTPAVTGNKFGKGTAYYVGSDAEQAFYDDFYEMLVKEKGIALPISGKIPEGVEVTTRSVEDVDFIFVQNYRNEAVDIKIMNLQGEIICGDSRENLKAYETLILKKNL